MPSAVSSSAAPRPTTAGMPIARARIAACEVALPCEVATPWTRSRSSAAVSPGVRSAATSTPGPSSVAGAAPVPLRWPSTRRPTSSTSAARSRRYGVVRPAVGIGRVAHRGVPGLGGVRALLVDGSAGGVDQRLVVEQQQVGVEDRRLGLPRARRRPGRGQRARRRARRRAPPRGGATRPRRRPRGVGDDRLGRPQPTRGADGHAGGDGQAAQGIARRGRRGRRGWLARRGARRRAARRSTACERTHPGRRRLVLASAGRRRLLLLARHRPSSRPPAPRSPRAPGPRPAPRARTRISWPWRTPSVASAVRLRALTGPRPVVSLETSTRTSAPEQAPTKRAAGRACRPSRFSTRRRSSCAGPSSSSPTAFSSEDRRAPPAAASSSPPSCATFARSAPRASAATSCSDAPPRAAAAAATAPSTSGASASITRMRRRPASRRPSRRSSARCRGP